MSNLDRLLRSYAPPSVPEGLAERAAAAAVKLPQEKRRWTPWRRRDGRGGWKRPLLVGGATFGLAFTSAVAATVVSEGRIHIPVVREIVAAVPILNVDLPEPEQVSAEPQAAPVAADGAPEEQAASTVPDKPVVRVLKRMKESVDRRRAAGQPTPRADRIEATAETIVERREAAGLPAPKVETVEAALALRELRRVQVRRMIERMTPAQRAWFERLPPERKRRLIRRHLRRLAQRQALAEQQNTGAPQTEIAAEGIPEAAR